MRKRVMKRERLRAGGGGSEATPDGGYNRVTPRRSTYALVAAFLLRSRCSSEGEKRTDRDRSYTPKVWGVKIR